MTNHTGDYGVNKTFSSFRELSRRASLPREVHEELKFQHGVTSMATFCSTATLIRINAMFDEQRVTPEAHRQAISVWNAARKARTDLVKGGRVINSNVEDIDEDNGEYEVPKDEEILVNADRNELVALLQGHKGAQFVSVHMQHSRLDEHDEAKVRIAPKLVYKAVDLDLKVGDYVVVQYRDRLGIAVVHHLFEETPTSDEYDYRNPLRHVIQKIDVKRSKQLTLLDRDILRKITASEAQDRMERLTRQLGLAMADVTLALPNLPDED